MSFWAVSRVPAVGVGEVVYELGGGGGEEFRVFVAFGGVVDETVDAAAADVFVEAVLFDDAAEVGAGADPVALLDDAAVDVDYVEAAVGAGGHVERAEVGVGGADELGAGGGVAEDDLAGVVGDFGAADEAADGFGDEEIAVEVGGEAVAAVDVLPGAAGEIV